MFKLFDKMEQYTGMAYKNGLKPKKIKLKI